MHQSGQSDGDCPRENTGWGMMDALLTTQGRHRLRSARRSDLLVVRLFIATEELKKWTGKSKGGSGTVFQVVPAECKGQHGRKVFAQVADCLWHRGERGEN